MLAVIAEAMNVATEIRGVPSTAMETLTLITNLIIQHIGLDFYLWVTKMMFTTADVGSESVYVTQLNKPVLTTVVTHLFIYITIGNL